MIRMRGHWMAIGLILIAVIFTARGFSESALNFPRIVSESGAYTGFALANPTDQTAEIILTAYDESGRRIQGADVRNPFTLTLDARSQVSYLDWEFFNFTEPVSGWVQAISPVDGLIGSFLLGGMQGEFLDGAEAPSPYPEMVFPLIMQENGGLTEISLINPNEAVAELKLRLYNTKGERLATQALTLGARQALRAVVPTLFTAVSNFSQASHILVTSQCAIIGFEWVRNFNAPRIRRAKRTDRIGLNAVPLSKSAGRSTLYFPHLTSGDQFFAWIGLVNLSERAQRVTITAYRPDGTLYTGSGIRNPVSVSVPPLGALRETAQALFAFPSSPLTTGWVKAEGDTGALAGFITYGHRVTASLAVVAGQTRGFETTAYAQVTEGAGYFTGLALINPGDKPARVEVFSLRADGSTVGIFRKRLKAHESVAKLVHEMIRDAEGQVQGYLFIRADRPVISTEVLGSRDGRVLMNVPAQAVTQTFNPDTGPDVWIDTDLGDEVVWRQRTFAELAGGRQLVNVIVAPPSAYLAPRNTNARTTSRTAQEENAKAAINGGFFTFDASFTSVSLVKIDGVQTASNTANRSVFGILERDYGTRTITTIPAGAPYPEAYHALGGGPRLIRDGEIYIPYQMESFTNTFSSTRHPRTGLGLGMDGAAYLVTVDGRGAGGAAGMSLNDFAQLLLDLGSFQALNLDGDGATTMWVGEYGVVNHPSDGSERRVSNILAVW